MRSRVLFLCVSLCLTAAPPAAPAEPQLDGISRLLQRLEKAIVSGDASQYLQLLASSADPRPARTFAEAVFTPGVTRAAVRERDRTPLLGTLPGDGYSLVLDVLTETGARAQLATWRLDVRRKAGDEPDQWGILFQEPVSSLQGLYRLSVNATREFAARNLVVRAEDLELRFPQGSVFTVDVDQGTTALVLVGRGEMVFRPAPVTERGQIKLFCGSETLQTGFDVAVVRFNPVALSQYIEQDALVERPVDPRELQRADESFREDVGKSFNLNLGDMSSDTWSLVPNPADFVAEVHTRRFDTLTYARSSGEAEDISLFDRARRRNLAVYASRRKLAQHGRFYDEDQLADFRVSHYAVDVTVNPGRGTIEGRATLTLRIQAPSVSSVTLRVAETLSVQSVVADLWGRLLAVPVRNQNALVVNFPGFVTRGTVMHLAVRYRGTVTAQPVDREAIELPQIVQGPDEAPIPLEPNYLLSNRSYWYPQSAVGDYATADLRITVPAGYTCVASGDLISETPPARRGARNATTTFVFEALQPVRYLACLVSRLVNVRNETVKALDSRRGADAGDEALRVGVSYERVAVSVRANARQQAKAKQIGARAADILKFYASLVGDCPYPSLSLAVVERELPGGHSPAYMTVLSQPVVGTRLDWSRDPASFGEFPDFFIAHELAHQWWGQAVGWKNYHEQWLSEGFAQYFALLYAEHTRGPAVFDSIVRRLYRWSLDDSDEGPIYLGYRVGHIKGDSRIFRAVVYNKAAAVLHMLRRLIGDDAFFRGIRRFYWRWRFQKAGSNDLQAAFEEESGRSLGRFFERWIYGSSLPNVRFTSSVDRTSLGPELVVRFEQVGEVFDMPITVTIEYVDRPPANIVVPLTAQIVEKRIPLAGAVRRVDANRDAAALVDLDK